MRFACTKAVLPVASVCCSMALVACGSTSSASTQVGGEDVSAVTAAANPIAVSPEPGTPDASPTTQISFLGGAGTKVADVMVRGSLSGRHSGVLRAYSTGTGESFIPSHAFSAGERVTVQGQVTAGTRTGRISTSFTVARQYTPGKKGFGLGPGNPKEVQRYSTAPTLRPSSVHIITPARPGAAPGDLFLAPYQGAGAAGPMITDQSGKLIWFHPLPNNDTATNFKVQRYEGKPVLTWWQGKVLEIGFGQGIWVLENSSYEQIATIRAGNGYRADLHEIRVTPEGTAWIDMFDPIYRNLSSSNGSPNGVLSDSVVEEVDIKTGLVMWEWHALGHIPLSESHTGAQRSSYPWDYVHINSIDPSTPGSVLLSSRNTWGIYDVDLHSGAIRWRLGGSHSDFKGPASTRFYWQHDAELQPGGLISVFDNGADPPEEKQSRGLLLEPNLSAHTVSLREQFVNPSRTLLASSQGNTLALGGGDWLMGYGGLPDFTEYDSAGHVLLDGSLGKEVQDFRTYLSPWSGQPKSLPAVLASPNGAGALAVSVSWNGATGVASWRVLAGGSPTSMAAVAGAPRAGFQTTIAALTTGPYVQVQALDASGQVIGTSAVVKS